MGLKVVYGAPCSGKSTWVRENKKAADIVYDYDELTRAITYGKEHLSKREITHQYILDIRMQMIKRYRTNSDGHDFYLISTFLSDSFVEFVKDMNPEYIKMDVSKEECLNRLDKDDMRPDKDEWKAKIEEWFGKYGERAMPITKEYRYHKGYFNPYRKI